MGGCLTENQAIARSQYLDLVYSQSSTFYYLFPDALRPSTDPKSSKPPEKPPINGIIGSMTQNSNKSSSNKKSVLTTTSNPPSNPSLDPGKTSKVLSFTLPWYTKPQKVKRRVKEKKILIPQSRILPIHLLMIHLNISPNMISSFVRKIIIPRIVPIVQELVSC